MRTSYRSEDYLFASSAIRAKELSLIGEATVYAMACAKTEAEFRRLCEDKGISPSVGKYGEESYEPVLNERLCTAYREISDMMADASLLATLSYPYDCNNLKSALKCELRSCEVNPLLLPIGTVSVDNVKRAVAERDFSAFPDNMANAAEEALNTYAKTFSPQSIDLLLDKACFEDISAALGKTQHPFFIRLLKLRADTLNSFTALRLIKMSSPLSGELMENAYLCGGSIECESLKQIVTHGSETELGELLKNAENAEYQKLSTLLLSSDGATSLSKYEKYCDDIIMDAVKTAKYQTSGAEVAVAYLYAVEYEIKNMRIIISARKAAQKSEKITERLRECYV